MANKFMFYFCLIIGVVVGALFTWLFWGLFDVKTALLIGLFCGGFAGTGIHFMLLQTIPRQRSAHEQIAYEQERARQEAISDYTREQQNRRDFAHHVKTYQDPFMPRYKKNVNLDNMIGFGQFKKRR